MKTRLLLAILLFVIGATNLLYAQEYRPFRVGAGFGTVPPIGFLLYLEPSLRLNKEFAVGVKVESAGLFWHSDIPIIGSYTANVQYYATQGQTRVFFGLGTGLYTTNSALLGYTTGTGESTPRETVWGFYPRFGVEHRHLVAAMEMNFVQSVRMLWQPDDPQTPSHYFDANPGYFSFKIGWLIGGGGL